MNPLNKTVANELKQQGIEFIHFVDISGLAEKRNRGFSSAILFGVKCSPEYLKRVSDNPNYVPDMVARNYFDDDEHYAYEMDMYRISDLLAEFIGKNGYKAYSLSDANQIATSNFDGMFGKTMLPLKTLATHAGLGWIGKNNLLVNKEFGCCQTWGGVLTDAPLNVVLKNPPVVQLENPARVAPVRQVGVDPLNQNKIAPLSVPADGVIFILVYLFLPTFILRTLSPVSSI